MHIRCHPLPVIAAIGFALALSGCLKAETRDQLEAAAERVVHKVGVACRTLDGDPVTVTVDVVAAATGQTDKVEMVRGVRQRVCAAAGMLEALAPEVAPVPASRP